LVAREIKREDFLKMLKKHLEFPLYQGSLE